MPADKNIRINHPVVILADGAFPSHTSALQCLHDARTIVCCDGAAEKLLAYGAEPHFIVGDLDSLSEEVKQRFPEKLYYYPSQETNDLTKAIHFCANCGVTQVSILGATGLREDHTIANISLLADYADLLAARIITDYGMFTAIKKTTTFSSSIGQQVSIFALTPSSRVTLHGLKYPLKEALLDSWWKGSLNESIGDSFTIAFDGGNIIVFQAF